MYDVIVIGAGPAGCTAAKILSERGCKVLLTERHRLPRYKSCSGVLIKKTLELVQMYFGEKVPESAACEPVRNFGMIFTDDKGKEYRFEQEGLNIWRSGFDGFLAEKAKECGTEIADRTSVLSCTQSESSVRVTLRRENREKCTEEAAYIIDCEGAAGVFKRTVIPSSPDSIITFQTFNEGSIDLDCHYFYAYLQRELSEYDAWFNVKDNLLVFGTAVEDREKIGYYYGNFISYMKSRHNLKIKKQLKSEKWIMPHIRPGHSINYGIGRVLFAGEAAGFLNPMGEGISCGMESGYNAANAVAKHFDDPDSACGCYERESFMLEAYMKRQWAFVGGLSERFSEMKNIAR